MSSEKEDGIVNKSRLSRRSFLMGAGAGAAVAAVAAAGLAEMSILQPQQTPGGSTTTITTTTTVTATTAPPAPQLFKDVTLSINGNPFTLQVKNNATLLRVLRDQLHFFATKEGCSRGECGACTVIVDGRAVYSCQMLAVESEGKTITTLEGLADYGSPNLTPLQAAFISHGSFECGACTPGFLMASKALLDANPHPTMDQIRQALSGHICICGQYKKIAEAVAAVGGA